MEKSYFFNSRDGDRVYNADSLAEAYAPLFANGVFNGELQVLADFGMNVKVMPGSAWINGRAYRNTEEKVLTLREAIGQEKRIDSVVIRLDEIEREIVAIVLKGEEDLEPEPPALQRDAGYYDLRIAEILVRPGMLEIGQADITDTRMDVEKCGWVAGAVKQISFEQMTAQFDSFLKLYKKAKEEEFLDWFGHTEAAREAAKTAESWAQLSKEIYENFEHSGNVTGVKGAEEIQFRTGNVILAPEDIGALQPSDLSPENIGNNGTGGISVGQGLIPSSYNTYTTIAEGSFFGASTYDDLYIQGETYYTVPLLVINVPSASAWLPYSGNIWYPNGKDIYMEDSKGAYNLETGVFEGIYVESPQNFYLCYSKEDMADYVARNSNSNNVLDFKMRKLVASGVFPNQTLLGSYNRTVDDADNALIIGNGTSRTKKSNTFRVTKYSNVYVGAGGAYNSSGADHAEFVKPWADGNPDNEDRVGYLVTVKDGFLYKAEEGDYIVGITSGNPCVVGNADEDYYWKYERDAFNRIVMEDVLETVHKTDEDGNPVFDEETGEPVMVETGRVVQQKKFAEGYNPALQESYIERKDRPEWDYVGMLGVLPVRDDGTCIPGQFCKCGKNGIAALADKRGFDTFFVLERIKEDVVSVQLKGL